MGITGPDFIGDLIGGHVRKTSARILVGGAAALALLLPAAVPSWAAEERYTVTGVVTLDGKPTAGIEVCDLFDNTICATTAADGSYTVEPLSHEYQSPMGTQSRACISVRPGPTLTDAFEGIAWMPRVNNECAVPVRESPVTRDFALSSYPRSWGQVVNSAGRPIVGASVASGRGRAESLTDAHGRFSVKMGPYAYDEHYLTVTAKGYQVMGVRFAQDGALGRIVMAPEGADNAKSVSGRVLDASGRPYVGVRLCVAQGDCFATADSDGTYYGLVTPVGDTWGSMDFELYRPENVTPILIHQSPVHTVGNIATNVDFRLNSARRIVGKTPKISGAPKIGKRLTVKLGTWLPKPLSIRCTWYVGSKVVKSSCSSLKVKASYRGKRIRVKVTGSRAGYASKTFASRATSRVYR